MLHLAKFVALGVMVSGEQKDETSGRYYGIIVTGEFLGLTENSRQNKAGFSLRFQPYPLLFVRGLLPPDFTQAPSIFVLCVRPWAPTRVPTQACPLSHICTI